MQNVDVNVLKKRNRKHVAHHTRNRKYPTIDEKVASIVDSKQYEDFFKTPKEVFGRTLSDAEKQYWMKKILPYQMQQLGYKGFIVKDYKKDSCAYATHLTQKLQPIYNKKQNTSHNNLTSQELELCRKIQKAYTGLLQLFGTASQKDEFKSSFPILDDWMHNHKVPTKKRVEVNKRYDMNCHDNIWHRNKYKMKVENDGFFVNTHKTMAEKKKHQTNILLSANDKKQDNKLIGNKRKTEDCLSNGFDNEDFIKKNDPFYLTFNNKTEDCLSNGFDNEDFIKKNDPFYLTFNNNVDKNKSIGNNFIFNDNGYENNSIGSNNSYNESLLNLNFDKTFKNFDK